MSPPVDGSGPWSARADRRRLRLLAAVLVVLLAVTVLRLAVSPAPWIRMTLACELKMGSSVDETLRVIERRKWQHGELETVGELGAVRAWVRDAYGDFSRGFPSSVDVIITFVFDREGALKRVELTEHRVSL